MVSQKMKLKISEKNNQLNYKIPKEYLPNLKKIQNLKYEIFYALWVISLFLTI